MFNSEAVDEHDVKNLPTLTPGSPVPRRQTRKSRYPNSAQADIFVSDMFHNFLKITLEEASCGFKRGQLLWLV